MKDKRACNIHRRELAPSTYERQESLQQGEGELWKARELVAGQAEKKSAPSGGPARPEEVNDDNTVTDNVYDINNDNNETTTTTTNDINSCQDESDRSIIFRHYSK